MAEQKLMERDPVCGMQVDPASARAKMEHGGRTYFFCCTGCAEKFEAAPEQYLKLRPTPSGSTLTPISPAAGPAPIQTAVPMHPSATPAASASAPGDPAVK